MQLRKHLSSIFIAAALATSLGCAATADRQSTAGYVEDSVITTKVKAAILNEPSLRVTEINVETYQGTVQLSGFVNSRADMSRAVVVARGVSGVTAVRDDMRLK
jgi:osmotically-inducible protein OsmY